MTYLYKNIHMSSINGNYVKLYYILKIEMLVNPKKYFHNYSYFYNRVINPSIQKCKTLEGFFESLYVSV